MFGEILAEPLFGHVGLIMQVTLARHAMATRFELVLHGENPVSLRAAGEEALDEIDRLEAQLSLYRGSSEIAHINARAAKEPVRVSPPLFTLLLQAQALSRETKGAFDVTVAPLVRCWGFMGDSGRLPNPAALTEAREKVGMHLVQLNPDDFTVRFACAGVMVDLGAIGKGYAIEKAAEILREAGVASALIHGGTSTVQAIGRPPGAECWTVAIAHPLPSSSAATLVNVPLVDEALSVSAVWGKAFRAEGKTFGHVLDPRTGAPVQGAVMAVVVLPSATESDALSTAMLILGKAGHHALASFRPEMRSLLAMESAETTLEFLGRGIAIKPFPDCNSG